MSTATKENRRAARPANIKEEKEKVVKVAIAIPEGGLDGVPEDYDPKVHKPLIRKDFKDEAIFFDWRADTLEDRVAFYRKRAEEVRTFGNVKDRVKARKIVKMQEKIADLRKELESQGIDVDSLLGN